MTREIFHYVDGYRGLLADVRQKIYAAWDVCLTDSENSSGELTLKIAPRNPEFNALVTMRSEISVEDDGSEIWRGRLIAQEMDKHGIKTLQIKGLMDYLHDSFLEPQTLQGSRSAVLQTVLAGHNSFGLEAYKNVSAGNVFEDGASIEYEIAQPKKTWEILSALVKEYGGLLACRRQDGVTFLDWTDDSTEARYKNSQTLVLGKNVLDLKSSVSGDKLATRIYGYGKKKDDVYLSPASANNGLPYVEDPVARTCFGIIAKPLIVSSAESAEALLEEMRKELEACVKEARTIEASAIDRYDRGDAQEMLRAGHSTQLIADPLSIDEWVNVSKIQRYLFEPHKTKVSLGSSLSTVSKLIIGDRL